MRCVTGALKHIADLQARVAELEGQLAAAQQFNADLTVDFKAAVAELGVLKCDQGADAYNMRLDTLRAANGWDGVVVIGYSKPTRPTKRGNVRVTATPMDNALILAMMDTGKRKMALHLSKTSLETPWRA